MQGMCEMTNKLITYIKEEEFEKLLKAEKKKEFKLAYLFAFGSGLRLSEIVGYKRKFRTKLNKETKIVEKFDDVKEILPLTADKIDLGRRIIRIIGGKGMKDRIVPLFPGFRQEYFKLLPLKIKRSTLQSHFKVLCKRVLGRDCHLHELRHGFAIANKNKGVGISDLQNALGHSRIETTGIYLKADPEDMLKSFNRAWGNI